MKQLLKLSALMVAGLFIQAAYAEGGCPPGYYPTNPSGAGSAQGCYPIYNNNASSSTPYSPPVKWADRWGAIVIGWHPNTDGIVGKSSNMKSKAEAETAAMNDCKSQGGGDTCYIAFAYRNQCAALAVGATHGSATAGDYTIDKAKQRAIETCATAGGKNCRAIYSVCSMPVQIQ